MRADAQRNHEKILEAAEESSRLTVWRCPIDLVAERAGVGIGTLYRHFPTKEALFEAIVLTRLNDLLCVADAAFKIPMPSPGAAFDAFLRELLARPRRSGTSSKRLIRRVSISSRYFAERLDDSSRALILSANARSNRGNTEMTSRHATSSISSAGRAAAGHSGVDDHEVQRLVSIVIAGIQRTSPL